MIWGLTLIVMFKSYFLPDLMQEKFLVNLIVSFSNLKEILMNTCISKVMFFSEPSFIFFPLHLFCKCIYSGFCFFHFDVSFYVLIQFMCHLFKMYVLKTNKNIFQG